jgi:hypothetical protein
MNSMRIISFLLCFSFSAPAQFFDTIPLSNKIKFIRFLQENRQYEDAWFLLHHFNSVQTTDSLQIMEAKLLLELRREKEADTLLEQLSEKWNDSSEFRCTFDLIRNHSRLMIGKYDSLRAPACKHGHHDEAWRIQLMSSYLLRKRTEDFELVSGAGSFNNAAMGQMASNLRKQKTLIASYHKKSGFVAGLFSAVIPGTGKVYAGKPHEALTGFVPVAVNFLQAGEGYYHKQLNSPHFYVFGAIGTMFYVSNIYGSARAVKRKKREFEEKIRIDIETEIVQLIKYY